MPKAHHHYGNAKIYRMNVGAYFYYGSTIASLSERKLSHRMAAEKYPERPLYKITNEVGWECVELELVERFPCENSSQLREREQYYVGQHSNDPFCLNRCAAYLTSEQCKEKKVARQRQRRATLTPEVKEMRRLRHNELQRKRRAALLLKNSDPL